MIQVSPFQRNLLLTRSTLSLEGFLLLLLNPLTHNAKIIILKFLQFPFEPEEKRYEPGLHAGKKLFFGRFFSRY